MSGRIAAAAAAFIVILAGLARPSSAAERVVDYSVAARGDVAVDYDAFVAAAAAAYGDPRGWSLDGSIRFRRVPTGGDLVLWLASPDAMTSFSDGCSPQWSCRVGRNVVINDLRFRSGSPFWNGSLADYRLLLINHETGHWIGFDHAQCSGSGDDAPVMMQQSKGVGACVGNPWPLADELREEARLLGVAAPGFDPPQTRGFSPIP
jgi:hypothetical protein